MLEQSLPDLWRHVYDAQLDVAAMNRADLAQEEALTALIEAVASGLNTLTPDSCHRRLMSLRRNRKHKHRYRRVLDRAIVGSDTLIDAGLLIQVAARRALKALGDTATVDELDTLVRIAMGWSVTAHGIPCGSARASRCT
jgi:hypothetical protein